MATSVVFNGVTYHVPAFNDTEYAQGSGNLSAYLIALANGPFPFKTTTSNPATAGAIRLAKMDSIDWRNNANNGNLPLAINAFDQLTFNGSILTTGVPGVSSITGTANQIIASSPTGAVTLSTPQDINTSSSPTFVGVTSTGVSSFQKAPVYAITSFAGTGTVTPDATFGPTFFTTVTGALTINGPINGYDGQKLTFRILNDASHSVTFATGSGNFRFNTDIPSYTNSVSLTDYIGAIWNNAATRWDIVAITKGA